MRADDEFGAGCDIERAVVIHRAPAALPTVPTSAPLEGRGAHIDVRQESRLYTLTQLITPSQWSVGTRRPCPMSESLCVFRVRGLAGDTNYHLIRNLGETDPMR